MFQDPRSETQCPLCGRSFECGAASGDCWCADLPALKPVPGRGCLCPACLEAELKARSERDPRP
ncbi:MAG TPA: cysteine-rich CWC family protein [Burkholderiales bacterium]|nr:cysteine-rich CWC family protein [Burkholderiales bacterium]